MKTPTPKAATPDDADQKSAAEAAAAKKAEDDKVATDAAAAKKVEDDKVAADAAAALLKTGPVCLSPVRYGGKTYEIGQALPAQISTEDRVQLKLSGCIA